MLTLAYVDCPTGISGDMCLGALVDAGVPLDYLDQWLQKLGISNEYALSSETVQRNGQAATKVHVHLSDASHTHHHHHSHEHDEYDCDGDDSGEHHHHLEQSRRHLPEITALIQTASLPQQVEEWSLAIFQNLAKAEGAVHGVSSDQVHFHEVGATDAIVDIVGTCLGFHYLGITQFYWSALPTGGGTIWAAHGRLPVPAPAVLRLWEMRQVPIYHNGIERELVTPTGAAIATTLATHFGASPAMQLHRVGLGAGSRDLPLPNMLRLWIGCESSIAGRPSVKAIAPSDQDHHHAPSHTGLPHEAVEHELVPHEPVPHEAVGHEQVLHEAVIVLETQIDDLSPQAIGYVFDELFQVGALDVFTQAVGMKKNRPGTLLTVICRPSDVESCEAVLFSETTTLGIRRTEQSRRILHREIQSIETPYGIVRLKLARRSPMAPIINVQPEYEDCARLARQHQLPWLTIHQAAIQSWHQLTP
ncbi:MAG: nickel pincer cofactor biosynthesis protein LarC [Cyanobacteria bacterium P01_A01_bin.37]